MKFITTISQVTKNKCNNYSIQFNNYSIQLLLLNTANIMIQFYRQKTEIDNDINAILKLIYFSEHLNCLEVRRTDSYGLYDVRQHEFRN